MVLDYTQLVGQQQAYTQSRLVSDVIAEQQAKEQAQREAVSTQAVSTTPKTETKMETVTTTRPTTELEQIDKQIRKLNRALDSATPKAEEIILERLRQLNESRENLINQGLAYYTTKTEVPVNVEVGVTPKYSESLAGGSRSDTQGLFYEIPMTDKTTSTPVYTLQPSTQGGYGKLVSTGQTINPITFQETYAYQPTVQTQTIKQQEQQFLQQLPSTFTTQQVTTPRTYSPQETVTTQTQGISFAQVNPQEYGQQLVQQGIIKANEPYKYLKQKQEEQLYSPFTLEKVPTVVGTTVGLFGAGAIKGVVTAPQFFSPTTYQGELQVPILTPTYQFGKYLVTGQYIPDLITNPAGTVGEFVGATQVLKATPFKQIGEAELKYGIYEPVKFVGEVVSKNKFLTTDILRGTIKETGELVPESIRAGEFLISRGITPTTPDIFGEPVRYVQPFGKEVPTTGQTSLTTGVEIKPQTFAEQSKVVDVATYPFSQAKNIPVYDEAGTLTGYKSIEINPLKTSESVFEQIGNTGQAKLIEDTIYYKIREGKFIPTETEPARGSLLQQAQAEKGFSEQVFDLRLERLSSKDTGYNFELKESGVTGQSSLTGDINRNLGASKVFNPQEEFNLFRVEGEQVRLKSYEPTTITLAEVESKAVKGEGFNDVLNTPELSIVGQRTLSGEYIPDVRVRELTAPLRETELFGAKRPIYGVVGGELKILGYEVPTEKIVISGKPENLIIPTGQVKLAESEVKLISLKDSFNPKTTVKEGNIFAGGEVVGYSLESGANILSKDYTVLTSNPNPLNIAREESAIRIRKGEEVVDVFPSKAKETQLDLFGKEAKVPTEVFLTNPLEEFMSDTSTMIDITKYNNIKSPDLSVNTDTSEVIDNSGYYDFEPTTDTGKSTKQFSSSIYANDKAIVTGLRVSDATFDTEVIRERPTNDNFIRIPISREKVVTELYPTTEIGVGTLNPRISTTEVFTPIQESTLMVGLGKVQSRYFSPELFIGLRTDQSLSLKESMDLSQDRIITQELSQSQSIGLLQQQSRKQSQEQRLEQLQLQLQEQRVSTTTENRITSTTTTGTGITFKPPTTINETPREPKVNEPIEPSRIIPKIETEEPKIPKKPKIFVEREKAKKKSKFVAVTKRRGKVVAIGGTESESKFEALGKGTRNVRETLARSLGVLNVETGQLESPTFLPSGFRPSKRTSSFVVQSNALSSQGEKMEIQSARKRKGVFA